MGRAERNMGRKNALQYRMRVAGGAGGDECQKAFNAVKAQLRR